MTACKYIFYHKQATSGRMRFMVFENASVLSGDSLPDLATLDSGYDDQRDEDSVVVPLSSQGFAETLGSIGLAGDQAVIRIPDVGHIETPEGSLAIHGVKLTDIDPPFEKAEQVNARFIEMTGARQLSPMDVEVLRRIYVFELGG